MAATAAMGLRYVRSRMVREWSLEKLDTIWFLTFAIFILWLMMFKNYLLTASVKVYEFSPALSKKKQFLKLFCELAVLYVLIHSLLKGIWYPKNSEIKYYNFFKWTSFFQDTRIRHLLNFNKTKLFKTFPFLYQLLFTSEYRQSWSIFFCWFNHHYTLPSYSSWYCVVYPYTLTWGNY